jgi:hypothetical protein
MLSPNRDHDEVLPANDRSPEVGKGRGINGSGPVNPSALFSTYLERNRVGQACYLAPPPM